MRDAKGSAAMRRAPALMPAWILVTFLALGSGACDRRHEEIARLEPDDPAVTGLVPPRPTGLTAEIGDRRISLAWGLEAGDSTDTFRVYRAAAAAAERVLATDLTATTYVDDDVTNGSLYSYRVSAVLNGFEGERAGPVVAVPAVYAILLEGGAVFANRTLLSLLLTAPAGTDVVRISESPDLEDAPWRAFQPATTFEIADGDGERTVYGQFRDVGGNETEIVSDTIILDTHAEILGVTHDAGAAPVPPGGTIHFDLDAGEPDGRAAVDIGSVRAGIELHDDGEHADGDAGDGVYGRDYVVAPGEEVADAPVVGHFEDAAGNSAEERTAAETITINGPPTAVELMAPFNVTSDSLSLGWSQNVDADFASYRVFRSQTPNVLDDLSRVLVEEIAVRSRTVTVDRGLSPATTYFYLVQVLDALGATAESNIVSARTDN